MSRNIRVPRFYDVPDHVGYWDLPKPSFFVTAGSHRRLVDADADIPGIPDMQRVNDMRFPIGDIMRPDPRRRKSKLGTYAKRDPVAKLADTIRRQNYRTGNTHEQWKTRVIQRMERRAQKRRTLQRRKNGHNTTEECNAAKVNAI